MENPLHPKRKRCDNNDKPSRRMIEEEEEEEAEDVEELLSDSDDEDHVGRRDLANRDTILITELKPEEYANAVTNLQGIGVAVVQDDLPYSTPMATMALDIPTHEVETIMRLLAAKWSGPGKVTVGRFKPVGNQIKLAIRTANKSEVAMVTAEALAAYTLRHGLEFDHRLVAVTMVVPGTWTLTLEDAELAGKLCSLYKVVLFGRELSIGPWKDSFKQSNHRAYVSGLAETASRQGIVEFFRLRCGEVTDHYFGKLPDSRMAPWITIEFKKASGLAKALEYNNRKSFNGKTISVSKAKTDEEREADLKRQSGTEARQAARAAAKQARQQRAADKRLNNVAAMAEYNQNALALARNFASGL